MRSLPARGGVAPQKSGWRLALLALAVALSVGIALTLESRVLESRAAHVLLPSDSVPLTSAPATVEDAGGLHDPALAEQRNGQDNQTLHADQQRLTDASDAAAGPASAPGPGSQSSAAGAGRSVPPAHALSRSQAVALVQRRYRARVVRAHVVQSPEGRRLYEMRLLSAGGMVWTVRLDVGSGAEVP